MPLYKIKSIDQGGHRKITLSAFRQPSNLNRYMNNCSGWLVARFSDSSSIQSSFSGGSFPSFVDYADTCHAIFSDNIFAEFHCFHNE